MANSEALKSTPASTPATAPSDTLLKGFRTTLDQRWKEFDEATMKEARNSPKAKLGNLLGMASEEDIRK